MYNKASISLYSHPVLPPMLIPKFESEFENQDLKKARVYIIEYR